MKKIVTSLAIVASLAGSLYAQNCDFKKDSKSYMKHKDCKGSKGHNKVLATIYELNLSDTQKKQIEDIVAEVRKNDITVADTFSKDSFDKAKFTKVMKEKREKEIENQALILEKTYKILDSKQKEQLKTLLDLKKDKMQDRFSR